MSERGLIDINNDLIYINNMYAKKKYLFLTFLIIKIFNFSYAQNNIINEFSFNLMRYFENKNSQFIYETINIYSILPPDDSFDENIMFFFFGVKKDDEKRYYDYFNTVLQSNNPRLISIFLNIERYDIDAYIENHEISARLNDIYWTLYFSSGNIYYLNKIIEIIQEYRNSDDLLLYMASSSGIWSFIVNIRDYPSVLIFINNIENTELKNYILRTPEMEHRQLILDHLRIQRENGIW